MKRMITSLRHALKEAGFELTDTSFKEKQTMALISAFIALK